MWRFYNLTTGIMLPRIFSGNASLAELNTPTGHAAIPGDYDHLSQRVDISVQPPPPVFDPVTGADISPPWYPPVIDYQPPAPAADTWRTWSWDTATKRWLAVPTLAAHKRSARQAMAAAWNAARAQGVTIGGKVAPTDADSWARYLSIKAMAGDGGWIDVPIPLTDDTFEMLTLTKANALWTALKTMERDLLGRLRDRIEAIAAATTQAEVKAITWA